jgi:hypothetical protein
MAAKDNLNAYVRLDASGRVVAGSQVFRKHKPKNGRWMEITTNPCCDADYIGELVVSEDAVSGITTDGFTIDWSDVRRASSYLIQVATDSAFTTVVYSTTRSTSDVTVTGLSSATTYYVKILATTGGSKPKNSGTITLTVTTA